MVGAHMLGGATYIFTHCETLYVESTEIIMRIPKRHNLIIAAPPPLTRIKPYFVEHRSSIPKITQRARAE